MPCVYIIPVEPLCCIATKDWSYDALSGAMLADKLGQLIKLIVGYVSVFNDPFKLTIIPLPLDTVYSADDADLITPPFNRPVYRLFSIHRNRVTLFSTPFVCAKYKSPCEPEE